MALPQVKQDVTEARLQALKMPEGAGWAVEARKAALSRLTQMGLPGARDEYWRFTNPGEFNAPEAAEAPPFDDGDESPVFGEIDRLKIVFRDGVFDAVASDDLSLEGVEIERLEDALSTDIHWLKDAYGAIEARTHAPVPRPFAALNTAFATDGVVLRATGKVSKPISLIYLHEKATSDAILHFVIRVEEGADLTVLENGPAAARFNKCMEVDVADGGAFHHVRAQGRDHERRAVTHLFATLGEESTFKSFTLTANGVMTRNEAWIELNGDNAVAHIAGAAVGDGRFHHDDTVFITHDAVNCESRQVFKKVLRNGAVGTFQGKILVKEGAQKTDGYQISQSLLLDEDAQFLAKPELEIYADDVACSHGSTSGAIDDEALFYLRSRGVEKGDAQDLLVLAFLAEAIEEIESEEIADDILGRLDGWLARRRS
ncbi:Fe-S cluster assembly protein SufD [Alphaproteobacteria bacterium GH1-50]|uniref:Fe-S cluster assembly protein SufD n=1 Tax=Kangsaoukella pontilimi TaxID=2691042 RepID=A0A7C9MCH7_9RHOB|nr:Fe-S cluster assembly protein SufD [Kangsaoukella pontilimi]MXQ07591.1 Fe-S cluster assembly protein SufD [Kangsaoukella pontilimi]